MATPAAFYTVFSIYLIRHVIARGRVPAAVGVVGPAPRRRAHYTRAVSASSPDRSAQFPAIERRYGQPVSFWLARLRDLDDARYATQMAYLQEEHGFSRAHANTLVMYARGSTSTRRFADLDAYLAGVTPVQAATVRAILAALDARFPDLETVIAWNKPLVRRGRTYVLGVAAASDHLLLLPWGDGALEAVAPHLAGLVRNKKTIEVPSDWVVDEGLLEALVRHRLGQADEPR